MIKFLMHKRSSCKKSRKFSADLATYPAKNAMEKSHPALIAALYRCFADYRAAYPLTLCQCASCMPPEEQRAFLAIPLRELPAPYLSAYLSSVPGDEESAYLSESKHFLPRICELLLEGAELSSLTETTLGKLNLQSSIWTADERSLLARFSRTFMTHIYRDNPFPHGLRDHSANYLLMFHWAGLDLTRELADIWTAHAHPPAALRDFMNLLEDMDWESGSIRWEKALYLPEHCPAREDFVAHMQAWFAAPHTRAAFYRALEAALLQGLENEAETMTWESWYDWLGETP